MAKITVISTFFLLVLALSAAAPAEKQPVEAKEELIAPVEAKEDLAAEKDDLKPAASHYGGWGYGGHLGGYGGHWGGYPYWGSSYWGYPSWGYGGYGYGWPYGGGWGGYGHGGYWW